jgi:hypothetical protein
MVMPLQVDAEREIRNGYPSGVYLPRDPGRRLRLLQVLGLRNNEQQEDVATTEPDYMLEGNDA